MRIAVGWLYAALPLLTMSDMPAGSRGRTDILSGPTPLAEDYALQAAMLLPEFELLPDLGAAALD